MKHILVTKKINQITGLKIWKTYSLHRDTLYDEVYGFIGLKHYEFASSEKFNEKS